jgi:hypothetical protein
LNEKTKLEIPGPKSDRAKNALPFCVCFAALDIRTSLSCRFVSTSRLRVVLDRPLPSPDQ